MCLGCGENLKEVSRKIIKGEINHGAPNYKVVYRCQKSTCGQKGLKKGFLDDGLIVIPLPDND